MDPEEVSGTTMRYNKTVFQLEKGLPPNTVVPKLKQRVESMKDKVCIVCDGHRSILIGEVVSIVPRSHSYCLSLLLCLEWYNGSITLRVHSGVTKRIQCRLHYRPLNKCVKPLSGV